MIKIFCFFIIGKNDILYIFSFELKKLLKYKYFSLYVFYIFVEWMWNFFKCFYIFLRNMIVKGFLN